MRQLQIAPRGGIEDHKPAGRVGRQGRDRLQRARVGLLEIVQHHRGGFEPRAHVFRPETAQRIRVEMLHEHILGGLAIDRVVLVAGDGRAGGSPDRVGQVNIDFLEQHFGGRKAAQLFEKLAGGRLCRRSR